MVTDADCLVQREKAIRDKVNTLEGLHKTCQLSAIGLSEPILNESRYLARALADVLFHDRGSDQYLAALQNAEHAARCAINDAVDILITFVKASLARIGKDYARYNLATSAFGSGLVATLEAMGQIDEKVVASRQSRDERDVIYQELADHKQELSTISEFALQLPRIEALACQLHNDQLELNDQSNLGATWIAEKLADALNKPTNGSILAVAFQPKYEIGNDDSRVCIGAEALTRFSINGSLISPATFIPIAEQTGLISQLGRFVLTEALCILRHHPELSSISVNVSPLELLDSEYSSKVIDMVKAVLGEEKNRLELEITESAAINDMDSFHHLEKLAKAGIRIAIDDFGTGLTTFDYLAKVDVGVLKIDQSLVRAFNRAPDTYRKLLKAITAVGNQCGLEVIAEGVENGAEVDMLFNEIGLRKFQGWYFGKAVTPEEFFSVHTSFGD